MLPTDFEEVGRADRKGDAATVARRLLGQFIYVDLKADIKVTSYAVALRSYVAVYFIAISIYLGSFRL